MWGRGWLFALRVVLTCACIPWSSKTFKNVASNAFASPLFPISMICAFCGPYLEYSSPHGRRCCRSSRGTVTSRMSPAFTPDQVTQEVMATLMRPLHLTKSLKRTLVSPTGSTFHIWCPASVPVRIDAVHKTVRGTEWSMAVCSA